MKNLEDIKFEEQKNVLYFIANLMSIKEQENFTIKMVNLCSQFYKFIPEAITTGYMYIIANDTYWKDSGTFEIGNVTDAACVEHLLMCQEEGGKALFLKCNYDLFKDQLKFKRNKVFGINRNDYDAASSFPYLDSAINLLYQNANGGKITDEIVENTLEQIKLTDSIDSDKKISGKTSEKHIVKALNQRSLAS